MPLRGSHHGHAHVGREVFDDNSPRCLIPRTSHLCQRQVIVRCTSLLLEKNFFALANKDAGRRQHNAPTSTSPLPGNTTHPTMHNSATTPPSSQPERPSPDPRAQPMAHPHTRHHCERQPGPQQSLSRPHLCASPVSCKTHTLVRNRTPNNAQTNDRNYFCF
uniref:Uncharacterized protein n=1 Tax=Rhipicephalus zambeziensis TaxID=60191 RepID=A0A224YGF9_9ACAR